MTDLVTWWCHLIGITDPAAISVAIGVVAVIVIPYLVLAIFAVLIGLLSAAFSD